MITQEDPYPAPGDFSFLRSHTDEYFLDDAYKAVTLADKWDYLRRNRPPANCGYMFWDTDEIKEIQKCMRRFDDHSGATYGITLNVIAHIARIGWTEYVKQRRASMDESEK